MSNQDLSFSETGTRRLEYDVRPATTQNVCERRYSTLLYLNVENQGDGKENPKVKNLCRTFKFHSLLDAK